MADRQVEFHRSGVAAWIVLTPLFNLIFGGISTQYLADHWLALDAAYFPWCFLFGLVFGGVTAPLALITFIILLFV